jgi:hypothetical protein
MDFLFGVIGKIGILVFAIVVISLVIRVTGKRKV